MTGGRKVVAVQLWRTFDEIVIPDGGTSVALGVFDGLHRGHRSGRCILYGRSRVLHRGCRSGRQVLG